ncbi:uncharacterized protein [Amphiura filiformis]|uniref:uncharacterized protein n=1 Tax=Amphiura filiformis TaxID=82378 RepID=UPI003B20F141
MAHMKDLNQQMKIQAERIRLQSRANGSLGQDSGYKSPSNGQLLQVGSRKRGHVMEHNVQDKRGKLPATSRPSAQDKDTATTPSKIPVRKPAPGMSTLKGKTKPGMSALKGKTLSGKQPTSGKLENKVTKVVRPEDYSWHKAGRIQELRIRYIARKFFKIWVAACFGKIGPDKIRAHYKKQLLRRAWREWHDMWWVNRREWRLQVRAQYHYRYCMTRKVWEAWVQYVVRQKIVNAKTNIADVHANTKVLQATFIAWKQYTSYRDIKKKNFGNAYRIADTRRLTQAWQQWRSQMQRLHDREDMQQCALQHWADGLIHKSWMRWRARLSSIAEMKRKEQQATETYHRSLLARCFYQGLMPYVLHRRDRKQDQGVASQFYINHLIQSSFHHWHTLWFTRKSLALLGQQIDAMAERVRLGRVWIH